jgi:hypothetical protein
MAGGMEADNLPSAVTSMWTKKKEKIKRKKK